MAVSRVKAKTCRGHNSILSPYRDKNKDKDNTEAFRTIFLDKIPVSIFLSMPGQIVFYAVCLSIMFFVPIAIVITRRRHAPPLKTKSPRGATAPQRLVGILVVLLIALFFGYTGIGLLPDWTYYLGLSISLLGFVIWFWGQQTLGRYYSLEVVVYQGHQLVERGPFRFMRHPMYTGLFLLWVGVGLAAQSWAGAVVIAIGTAINWSRIIPVEEKVLISEFGEQYISYSKRVKRLIPFIL